MSQISAAVVKELRDRTDMPMMKCKAALEKAGGDIEKAILVLREEGGKFLASDKGGAKRPRAESAPIPITRRSGPWSSCAVNRRRSLRTNGSSNWLTNWPGRWPRTRRPAWTTCSRKNSSPTRVAR